LTGISMLMGAGSVLSNHPSSYSTVVLFVVGGITFQEVSILQNMYREKGIHLIVGSNTICNRDSLMQHIFKSK
jgi:ribosomal protein L10